jgi:glutamine synthetase
VTDPAVTLERLEALSARYLWLVYHDYAGIGRAKVVPQARFGEVAAQGVTFAKANWDLAINDEQVPHPLFGADSGDFRVVPDPATVTPIPYRPGVVQALGRLVDDHGTPWVGDPRARLGDQVAKLAERGFHPRVAYEAEFLLGVDRGAGFVPGDAGRMFTTDEVEARWTWCERVLDTLEAMNVGVHQFAKEYGPGQYEVSLLPAEPVAAVDRFLLTRQTIRALARDDGLAAVFMPKPFEHLPGNGLHVHMGLHDGDGADVLGDPTADDALTSTGRSAVAGLLAHAGGLAALGSPTPNSYKRLLPGSWAPAHVCWGFGNRAALVRIPGKAGGRHIEYRSGDASANPYLFLAGLLGAIGDGIDGQLEPPPAVNEDVGHWTDAEATAAGIQRLPQRLDVALDAFAADDVLTRCVGPTVTEHYLAVKRFELASYLAGSGLPDVATEVSDWERATYLAHV